MKTEAFSCLIKRRDAGSGAQRESSASVCFVRRLIFWRQWARRQRKGASVQQPIVEDREVLQLRRQLDEARRELATLWQRVRHELTLAGQVHRSLLPHPVRNGPVHVDIRYLPIEQVGGDYCQVAFPVRDACHITISDATGHGIGSALLASCVSSEVRHALFYDRAPRELVGALNQFVYEHFAESPLFLSFVDARIDLARHEITYCGAGHPAPLLVRQRDRSVVRLTSQNLLLGVLQDALAREPENTLPIAPGDRLLFYTDGLTDTMTVDGQPLGIEELTEIVAFAMDVDLFEMADFILEQVVQHQHGAPVDDTTLIVAELMQ